MKLKIVIPNYKTFGIMTFNIYADVIGKINN